MAGATRHKGTPTKPRLSMQPAPVAQSQGRVIAFIRPGFLLIALLLCFLPICFTYAAEVDSTPPEDHNHYRIRLDTQQLEGGNAGSLSLQNEDDLGVWDGESAMYQSDFSAWNPGLDRSIIGRAMEGLTALRNSATANLNIDAGQTNNYILEKTEVFGGNTSADLGLMNPIAGVTGSKRKRLVVQEEGSEESSDTGARRTEKIYADDENDNVSALEDGKDDESNEVHELRRRQTGDSRTVYVTVNTCLQPSSDASFNDAMPQLTLYVSTDDSNPKPGPGRDTSLQTSQPLIQGFANITVQATGNVYVGVAAPSISNSTFKGGWNYEVGASTALPTRYFKQSTAFLWTVDTDSTSALLATKNLTSIDPPSSYDAERQLEDLRQAWMNTSVPFSMFVYNTSDRKVEGIQNSYCGLSLLNSGVNVTTGMTRRGFGGNPKQQFYADGLLPGQNYTATLAYNGPNISQVWAPLTFTTKVDGNCKLIYDLPFCNTIAYAVPYNYTNATQTLSTLRATYDSFAQSLYQNFTNSLDQIACNTSSSSQYSLVRNCDDCARDYKTWLCAVTIPKCADFSTPLSSDTSFLVPREVASPFPNGTSPDLNAAGLNASMTGILRYNSSRSPIIDTDIVPGPYKEVLPCRDLCYDLVRSCPAALGFSCPVQEALWNRSYGVLNFGMLAAGQLTCNYPGVDWPDVSAGRRITGGFTGWIALVGLVGVVTALI